MMLISSIFILCEKIINILSSKIFVFFVNDISALTGFSSYILLASLSIFNIFFILGKIFLLMNNYKYNLWLCLLLLKINYLCIWKVKSIYLFYIMRGIQGFLLGNIEVITISIIAATYKNNKLINLFNNTTPFILPLLCFFYYVFNLNYLQNFMNILLILLMILIYFIPPIFHKEKNFIMISNISLFIYTIIIGISFASSMCLSSMAIIHNKTLLSFITNKFYIALPLIISGIIGIFVPKNIYTLISNILLMMISLLILFHPIGVMLFIFSTYNFYFIFSTWLVLHVLPSIKDHLKWIYIWKHITSGFILWIINIINIHIKYKVCILFVLTVLFYYLSLVYKKRFLQLKV